MVNVNKYKANVVFKNKLKYDLYHLLMNKRYYYLYIL